MAEPFKGINIRLGYGRINGEQSTSSYGELAESRDGEYAAQVADEHRSKLEKLDASCLQLIRTKLIDMDARDAARIIVGMTRGIYADDRQATDQWTKVVEREQKRLASKRTDKSKSSVDKRNSYRAAVKALPKSPPKGAYPPHTAVHVKSDG
jgi:hypothetical protein